MRTPRSMQRRPVRFWSLTVRTSPRSKRGRITLASVKCPSCSRVKFRTGVGRKSCSSPSKRTPRHVQRSGRSSEAKTNQRGTTDDGKTSSTVWASPSASSGAENGRGKRATSTVPKTYLGSHPEKPQENCPAPGGGPKACFRASEQTRAPARLVELRGMSRFARKLSRSTARQVLVDTRALLELAADSLGFDAQQLADAQNGEGELADTLKARGLELLELLNGYMHEQGRTARAELEARNGAGFLSRVAAIGEPARAVVDRIRYSSANFSPLTRSAYTEGLHGVWSWEKSSGRFALSAPRSTSRRVFRTGFARAGVNSRETGTRSKSSWFGAAGAFASATSRTAIRTSRSNATTERLSARPMRATEGGKLHPRISLG